MQSRDLPERCKIQDGCWDIAIPRDYWLLPVSATHIQPAYIQMDDRAYFV